MKVGSFVANTTTGVQTVPVTFGSRPELAWFSCTLNTADDVFAAGAYVTNGFATPTGQAYSSSYAFDDAVNPNNSAGDVSAHVLRILGDGNGTVYAQADTFLWVAGTGFSINWTTAPAAGIKINYCIFEESEFEHGHVDLHTLAVPATTGTFSKSGLGFAPDTFFFMAGGQQTALGAQTASGLCLGWATAVGSEMSYSNLAFDNSTAGNVRYERVDRCLTALSSVGIAYELNLASLQTTGYTLNNNVAGAARQIVVVAAKRNVSSSWATATATAPTTPGTQLITVGFQADSLLMNGGFHVANNTRQAGDSDHHQAWADGVAGTGTQRFASGVLGGSVAPSRGKSVVSADFSRHYTSANVVESRIQWSARSATQVTLNHISTSPTARRMMLLAVKAGSVPPPDLPPAAPTGLVGLPSGTQITVDWNDNTEGDLAGYNIYRDVTSTVPLSSPLNGGTLLSSSNYANTGLTTNTTYYYVVEAVDAGGNKTPSSVLSVFLPSAITSPTDQLILSVNHVDGVTRTFVITAGVPIVPADEEERFILEELAKDYGFSVG